VTLRGRERLRSVPTILPSLGLAERQTVIYAARPHIVPAGVPIVIMLIARGELKFHSWAPAFAFAVTVHNPASRI
jgi:hypothetical protein